MLWGFTSHVLHISTELSIFKVEYNIDCQASTPATSQCNQASNLDLHHEFNQSRFSQEVISALKTTRSNLLLMLSGYVSPTSGLKSDWRRHWAHLLSPPGKGKQNRNLGQSLLMNLNMIPQTWMESHVWQVIFQGQWNRKVEMKIFFSVSSFLKFLALFHMGVNAAVIYWKITKIL